MPLGLLIRSRGAFYACMGFPEVKAPKLSMSLQKPSNAKVLTLDRSIQPLNLSDEIFSQSALSPSQEVLHVDDEDDDGEVQLELDFAHDASNVSQDTMKQLEEVRIVIPRFAILF
jgi:hypothetical protein